MPPRPAPGQPRTDDDKAAYVTDLRGAFLDCKGTVDAIAVRRAKLDAQASAAQPGFHLHLPAIHFPWQAKSAK